MSKYKLNVTCGYAGCDWTDDLDWLTDEDYERHINGEESKDIDEELFQAAIERASFEWVVEKID